MLDRADDDAAHEAGVAEPHFGLGGMHVDVDLARIAVEEEDRDAVPLARQIIEIGAAQRAGDQFVAHRAAVDEGELASARSACCRWAGRPSRQTRKPSRVGVEAAARCRRIRRRAPGAAARARPLRPRRRRASRTTAPISLAKEKRTLRIGEREPAHDVGAGLRLARDRSSGISAAPASRRRDRAPRCACPADARTGSSAPLRPSSTRSAKRLARRARASGFRAARPRRSRAAPRRESRASRCG